jgi:hypothetical protein
MLVNDEGREIEGRLTLTLENNQKEKVATQTTSFKIAAFGQKTLYSDFVFPKTAGNFLLRAIIQHTEDANTISTQSRRQVKLVEPKPHDQH